MDVGGSEGERGVSLFLFDASLFVFNEGVGFDFLPFGVVVADVEHAQKGIILGDKTECKEAFFQGKRREFCNGGR